MAGTFRYTAGGDYAAGSSADIYLRDSPLTLADAMTALGGAATTLRVGDFTDVLTWTGTGMVAGYTTNNFVYLSDTANSLAYLQQTIGGFYLDWSGQNLDSHLYGGGFADILTGGAGTDILNGGGGADILTGGLGDDTYVVDNVADIVVEAAGEGTDTVRASVSHALSGNVENLIFTVDGDLDARGNSLANVITGNAGSNYLKGEAGDDTLLGNGGNDRLDGGTGADTMEGGAGDDVYYVDDDGDVVTELAGQGTDTVYTGISYYLPEYVEYLKMTGADGLLGVGNAQGNRITGNAGDNIIEGREGVDTLTGGAGFDVFGFNTVLGEDQGDRITDFIPGVDKIALDTGIFTAMQGTIGNMPAEFFADLTAVTADSHIIYDSARGILYYDEDGLGGSAAIRFAVLTGAPPLSETNFLIL